VEGRSALDAGCCDPALRQLAGTEQGLYWPAGSAAAGHSRDLVEQMEKIDTWASQTVEARRGSLIENVEQYMKGRGGRQEIRAEDDSIISGVKQIIE